MKFDADYLVEKKKAQPCGVKSMPQAVLKELDATNRTVTLVANTLNFFDYDFDVLLKGCANRSISQRGAKSEAPDKIAHLLFHNMNRPVGKSLSETEEMVDGKLALVCSSYMPETIDGDDTLTNYEAGVYNQHSIGFKYLDLEFVEKGALGWDKFIATLINPEEADSVGYGWGVKEIKWWEYSTVTFGANKLTPYLGTKSENKVDIADALSKKIAILATKAMRRDIINKEAFNYELSQLQQMVYELSEYVSPKDSTSKDGSLNISTQKIELSGFSKKLKLI